MAGAAGVNKVGVALATPSPNATQTWVTAGKASPTITSMSVFNVTPMPQPRGATRGPTEQNYYGATTPRWVASFHPDARGPTEPKHGAEFTWLPFDATGRDFPRRSQTFVVQVEGSQEFKHVGKGAESNDSSYARYAFPNWKVPDFIALLGEPRTWPTSTVQLMHILLQWGSLLCMRIVQLLQAEPIQYRSPKDFVYLVKQAWKKLIEGDELTSTGPPTIRPLYWQRTSTPSRRLRGASPIGDGPPEVASVRTTTGAITKWLGMNIFTTKKPKILSLIHI